MPEEMLERILTEECQLVFLQEKDNQHYCKKVEDCPWKLLGKDYSFQCGYARYQKERKELMKVEPDVMA